MRIHLGPKGRYHFSETAELEHREILLSLFGRVRHDATARVGRIAHDLAFVIGAQTDIVEVRPITVMKVKGKHAQILYSDLELLQTGFNAGRVQRDHPLRLTFLFRDPRNPQRTLKAVIKTNRARDELWLVTYFPCTGKRLTAALKKGDLIRDW
jgi:hypothetical protein